MAKIGFEYVVAGELDESVSKDAETAKYKNAREIGPAAKANGSPTTSDVKDYGDDHAVETDVSVTGGAVSLELNEPTLENEAWILGHKYAENGGMIRNANDIPPFVGIGFVGKSRRDNKTVFKTKIYLKAQFKEPNDENQTKQENITFSHTTMEGNLYQLENGDWKKEQEYTTLDAAKAALDTFFGLTTGTGA